MQKSFTLFLCLIFCSLIGRAQSNFKPGLVVTSAGDTLKGFIDHREWIRNPDEFTFKTAVDGSQEQKFNSGNSKYVEINGIEAYQSERVDISQASMDIANLSHGPNTTILADTVFLRVLYSGNNVSLFTYRDKIKERFYTQETTENSAPQELIHRRYYIVGQLNRITTESTYRNQLWTLAIKNKAATDAFQRKISSARYEKEQILAVIRQIDGSQMQVSSSSLEKAPKTRFLAGIWMNRASMSQKGEISKFSTGNVKESTSLLPKLSIGLDAFANPNTQRLLLRTELSVSIANPSLTREYTPYSSITYFYKYEYKQLSASLNPQVLYNVYNTEKLKVYLAPGLIGTVAKYTKDTYSSSYTTGRTETGDATTSITLEDYETPQTFWYSYTARAGVVLFNKLDLSLLYTGHDISKRLNYSIDTKSISLGASYLFNRKQN